MTTPEGLNTPEIQPNPLGIELTGKITEMMQHPKSDITESLVMEEHYRNGAEAADELRTLGVSQFTAYRRSDLGISAVLQMPETGSPMFFDDETRWKINLNVAVDRQDSYRVYNRYDIEIDEVSYDVSLSTETVVYHGGRLVGYGSRIPDFVSKSMTEEARDILNKMRGKEIEPLPSGRDYEKGLDYEEIVEEVAYPEHLHEIILTKLGEFSELDEDINYDPSNVWSLFE